MEAHRYLSDAHRRYLRIEMTVAAAISAVLSIVFVLLVFGAPAFVPMRGWNGLIVDAAPQSLMIALMSSLVPTWLTRRRRTAGAIAPLSAGRSWPRPALVRSLCIAVPVAVVAVLAHAILLPLTGERWSFVAVLSFKAIYGALLGAVVARVAVTAALADPVDA
ncbi:hypothetical protein [Sphingomonas mollis]|uniref:Uncharacterized protein n=1 Tax=Sphingomonas mollis TaxID=2795726 RepID=A0ABS0XQD2_9SPHN|nr:hypothetical protein [Sphingomonas sp. BT553]MBJ6121995.1 hypothetical protein [Sphingomonas sp. BT553]